MRVVVVGGSIAGLTAGLALSRRGHDVTIVERDRQPLPESPEAAAGSWRRGGVPQVRQGHGFISRARAELLEHAPDLWQDLLDAGGVELSLVAQRRATLDDYAGDPDDAQHAFLLCRRTTFEWVLRRAAERECAVVLGTRVAGLLTDGSGVRPRVTGVATSQGALAADLVVDTTGRSGGLAARVRAAGGTVTEVGDESCGLVYATRFYRLRDGAPWGPLNRMWAAGGTFAGYTSAVFPADNRTFSVGFGRMPEDEELKAAQTADGFARAVALIPYVADWVDAERAEPLGPPVPMAGIHNMLTLVSGVTGLFAIGDAVCTTDPSFGRGAAVAIASAFEVARAIAGSDGDLAAAGERVDAWFAADVVPWHDDAVAADRGRTAMWERSLAASLAGRASTSPATTTPVPPAAAGGPPPVGPALVAAAGVTGPDPVVWRAFVAYAGMLTPPSALMAPEVVDRVRALTATGWTPPDLGAPSHRELVEAVTP